jgi:hypothetical protein
MRSHPPNRGGQPQPPTMAGVAQNGGLFVNDPSVSVARTVIDAREPGWGQRCPSTKSIARRMVLLPLPFAPASAVSGARLTRALSRDRSSRP